MFAVCLPHFQDGHWWYVSRWSGSLLRSVYPPPFSGGGISDRVLQAIDNCEKPFTCRWSHIHPSIHLSPTDSLSLERMNRRMFALGNKRFLASIIYAGWNSPIFQNTNIAFAAVSKLVGHKDSPNDRCLQRSLLAAKTSHSFKKSGVLFIGAEFSSGEMHAWVIEDGEQPDPDDRTWINYRPLLAVHG